VIQKPTFLEYLRGGIQLNVMVAVDFTQSNGDPKISTSLHALKQDSYNDYQKAIAGVCQILLCYDYDKKIAMYGFGGKPKGETQVNHCFSLTGDEKNAYADGLDGIMQVYKMSLDNVKLSGPTFFNPIAQKALSFAKEEKQNGSKVYTICLMLTDGMIHDMRQTIDSLYDAAHLPLSFIIVGVGNEDFTKMRQLDADDEPLCNSKGERLKRDLVQFVPFNQFSGDKEKLAEEVLAEVPRQFLEYMAHEGINPAPRPEFDINRMFTSQQSLQFESSPMNRLSQPNTRPSTTKVTMTPVNMKHIEEEKANLEDEPNLFDDIDISIKDSKRDPKQDEKPRSGGDSPLIKLDKNLWNEDK
jgi:hypothetical protein